MEIVHPANDLPAIHLSVSSVPLCFKKIKTQGNREHREREYSDQINTFLSFKFFMQKKCTKINLKYLIDSCVQRKVRAILNFSLA